MNQKNDLVTVKDVAEFLKVAEKTIYRMAAEGKIPAYKVGGSWRFKRAEIEVWLEKQKN